MGADMNVKSFIKWLRNVTAETTFVSALSGRDQGGSLPVR